MPKIELSFHNKVSLVKSGFRIVAGGALITATWKGVVVAGIFLMIAEALGIAEEIDS